MAVCLLSKIGSNDSLKVNDKAIDKGRAYDIELLLVYQDRGQLKVCFPKDEGQILLSNTSQVYFGTNSYDTAEEISRRCGDHTVVAESGSRGSGTSVQKQISRHGGTSVSTNSNANWNQVSRRLLKPEEVIGLDERIAITFALASPPTIASPCCGSNKWPNGLIFQFQQRTSCSKKGEFLLPLTASAARSVSLEEQIAAFLSDTARGREPPPNGRPSAAPKHLKVR